MRTMLKSVSERLACLRPGCLGPDILAGLTLWGVLVPEGLAYASLAGMPVEAGLYTLLASLPLYFLFGGSSVLVCAATSAESIMMAAIVTPLAGGDPARYAALTATLVFTTGIVFLAAGFLKLGRLTTFLSKPVMTGFIFGLAVYIAANQLHKLLGLPRGTGDTLMQLAQLAEHLGRTNPATLAVGGGALALLFLFERLAPRLPACLGVMALGIAASRLFDLGGSHGVATTRTFPAGLPDLHLPLAGAADVAALAPAALGLALVAFSQALGAQESYAERQGGRHADADRELKALGLANIGSASLGGLLAGGSMSSTAVNVSAGCRSQASTLVTAAMVLLTLCFLTPILRGLPEAVLGAVVLHAVVRLMKVAELKRYARLNPPEFVLALIALCGVPLLDILPGLVVAVAASLLRLIMHASDVHTTVLGITPNSPAWFDVHQNPEAREIPGVRFIRMDGPLFFANAEKFRGRVKALCGPESGIRAVGLYLKSNRRMCITTTDMMLSLVRELRAAGVRLAVVDPDPEVLRVLRQSGLADLMGEDHIYPNMTQAAADLRARYSAGR